jgi:uncharacterized protein with GYD domain
MAFYMIQSAYTPQGWAALVKNPHDRLEAVRPSVERLGGRIVSGWMMFGEYDLMLILDMPDNASAAALSIAAAAGGALRNIRTWPLLTLEEGVAAMQKASQSAYEPPPSDVPYFGA